MTHDFYAMQFANHLIELPREVKRGIALTCDMLMCVITVWVAFYLRTGIFYAFFHNSVVLAAVVSIALAIPTFTSHGLYRAIFRYEGFAAAQAIAKALLIYSGLYVLIFVVCGPIQGVPRTVGFIQPALLFTSVAFSRGIARFWLSGEYRMHLKNMDLPRVAIFGAGDAGRQLLTALESSHRVNIVAFFDDDKSLQELFVGGVKVHSSEDMRSVIERKRISAVLLAIPSASSARRKAIIETLSTMKVQVRTLPAIAEIASGKISVNALRNVSIEELLGRAPVEPIEELLTKTIKEKVVMVTGAGGSIGSELCRQILRIRPKVLLLVERTEFALYAIDSELREKFNHDGIKIVALLADVKDEVRMREIMTTWKVNTVYHAAAYKHVPLVEHNPLEGIINNVFGTWITARVARDYGVEHFTLISTDKAVRPTNVMGASKRLCELILQSMASEKSGKTIFTMVRFGNVLGSSGSVVPRFRQQIKEGGPVTVTHKDIIRYFMTIPEASQLVVQAASLGQGGDVFILDMGEPVRIMDLARRMIELSGLTVKDESNPEGGIEIRVTGLRPGEKLFEELLVEGNPNGTKHPRIFYAKEVAQPRADLLVFLGNLKAILERRDREALIKAIHELVPEYKPQGGIVDWVNLEEGEPLAQVQG